MPLPNSSNNRGAARRRRRLNEPPVDASNDDQELKLKDRAALLETPPLPSARINRAGGNVGQLGRYPVYISPCPLVQS